MSMDRHIRRGHPTVFGLLIFFGVIELAISAWLTAHFRADHNSFDSTERTRTTYTLFVSCWTVFFSIMYLVLFLHSPTGSFLTSVASHGILLFFTWVFWTAAAASITQMLGGGLNCSHSDVTYCNQLNAMEAFAWVEWILVTFAIIVVLVRGISASRRGDGFNGGLVNV